MIYEAIYCRFTVPCLIIWTAHFLRFVMFNNIDLYRAIVTVLQYNSGVLLWYLQKSCAISGGTKLPWSPDSGQSAFFFHSEPRYWGF